MTATAVTAIVSDRKQVIKLSEFSLVQLQTQQGKDSIAGRLRFPPGCARAAIREIINLLVQHQATILSQECIGDRIATTGWSSLIFNAQRRTYQQLMRTAHPSNLKVVRESTEMLLQELEVFATSGKATVETETQLSGETVDVRTESTVETEPVVETSAEIAEWSVISDADKTENLALADVSTAPTTTYVTAEQLGQLTLAKLKELASKHNIEGRSSMTKNLDTAHQLLIPKLVGLVTVAEL